MAEFAYRQAYEEKPRLIYTTEKPVLVRMVMVSQTHSSSATLSLSLIPGHLRHFTPKGNT